MRNPVAPGLTPAEFFSRSACRAKPLALKDSTRLSARRQSKPWLAEHWQGNARTEA